MTDSAGNVINVYAVELGGNNVVGFVTDAPMTLGETYTFLDRTSTHPSTDFAFVADTYFDVGGNTGNDGDTGVAGGDDSIDGGAGDDTILGQDGKDSIHGGEGEPLLPGLSTL